MREIKMDERVKEWIGDAVRFDEYGYIIWTQPDHHRLLDTGNDLDYSNPNAEAYLKFAVDAINESIKGVFTKSNLPMQQFFYSSEDQQIRSGDMDLLSLRGWGEIQYLDDPAVLHDKIGTWIAEVLNEKRLA